MTFLKDCPKCGMTVAAHCECPLCRTDLTNEPYAETETEKYAFNKYLFVYIIKFAKFLIFCVALCLAAFIIKLPDVSWLYLISLFCLSVCFCETFFSNRFNSMWRAVYSENYLEATKRITKYSSGILAVVIFILS